MTKLDSELERILLIARTDLGSKENKKQAIKSILLDLVEELCGEEESPELRGKTGDERIVLLSKAIARNRLRQEIKQRAREIIRRA